MFSVEALLFYLSYLALQSIWNCFIVQYQVWSINIFPCGYPIVSTSFIEKDHPFLNALQCCLCHKTVLIDVRVYFWILCYISFASLSIFAPNPQCLNYSIFIINCHYLVVSVSSIFSFFFKITLDIFGLLHFHMNCRTSLLISAEEPLKF